MLLLLALLSIALFSSCKKKEPDKDPTQEEPAQDYAFSQDTYLKASNSNTTDQFGYSVAISNDLIVIGAPFEESNAASVYNPDGSADSDNSSADTGAVYVYKKDSSGEWVQDAYLKASNSDTTDLFGYSVAVGGDLIVVGAPFEESNMTGINNIDGSADADNSSADSGAVYVYKKDASGNWVQDAYLKASNSDTTDLFGYAVDVSNDVIVVGAPYEESSATAINNSDGSADSDNSSADSGAAYIFKKDASDNWVQDAYLKASNSSDLDAFGSSLGISGDFIVIGAYRENGGNRGIINEDGSAADYDIGGEPGAAYVFKKDASGNWVQDAYLKASHISNDAAFGKSIAISGDIVVIGSPWESSNTTEIINDDGSADHNHYGYQSGAAYVFKRETSGDWIQDAYLKASNSNYDDRFGSSVAVNSSLLVVGAPLEDSIDFVINNTDGSAEDTESCVNCNEDSGAAYVFKKDAVGDWVQDAYLKASNNDAEDQFGQSLAINSNQIVVGAFMEESADTTIDNTDGSASDDDSTSDTGAAYIFKR